MNQPNESLIKSIPSKLPILFKGHGGLVIPLSTRLNLSPNILIMMQNNVVQYNGGMYLNYELVSDPADYIIPSMLTLGTWYRAGDSFIMSLGFGSKNYLFGFSYDFNNSSLRYSTQGRGAFEFSLSIRQIKHKDAIRRFHTPRI
jgi:type IX secretion system PorP/SprF family membrane protein